MLDDRLFAVFNDEYEIPNISVRMFISNPPVLFCNCFEIRYISTYAPARFGGVCSHIEKIYKQFSFKKMENNILWFAFKSDEIKDSTAAFDLSICRPFDIILNQLFPNDDEYIKFFKLRTTDDIVSVNNYKKSRNIDFKIKE